MTDPTCTARSLERQLEDDGDGNEGDRAATADGDAAGVSPGDRPDDSIGTESVGDESDAPDEDVRSHLRDVPAGSGCTEIWEHLAENRDDDE